MSKLTELLQKQATLTKEVSTLDGFLLATDLTAPKLTITAGTGASILFEEKDSVARAKVLEVLEAENVALSGELAEVNRRVAALEVLV